MNKQSVKISTPDPDDALRVGAFDLLPIINRPPVITSHPARNFQQLTWATVVLENNVPKPELIDIRANPDGYTIRKGTSISWGLYCIDPSNLENLNDTSNLTFVWKRDGLPLYFYNRQNNGFGVEFLEFSEEECTEELNGVYTCEVSNAFGTTTSAPFTLEVLDLDNTDLLYTNLLLNGDADGGIEGWQNSDGQIQNITTNSSVTWTPSSITGYQSGWGSLRSGQSYQPLIPWAHSSEISEGQLFYNGFKAYDNANQPQALTNLNIPTTNLNPMPNYLTWVNTSCRVPIIPNEDYGKVGNFKSQGFYPGMNFIDRYNRNTGPQDRSGQALIRERNITLQREFGYGGFWQPLNYFGRKNLEFNKEKTSTFSQEIDINNLTNLTKGQVGGVDYLTAQFFSYVGNAISRYTIRCTIDGQTRNFNYFIYDYVAVNSYLGQYSNVSEAGVVRLQADEGTVIEIIPHADDSTKIYVDALDGSNKVLGTKTFNGPDALDVWAIKEKADWSLTLYPIFAFFDDNNNPINVFGQTYTTTRALKPLFNTDRENTGMLGSNSNLGYLISGNDILTDINAKFIVSRYGQLYSQWKPAFPRKAWQIRNGIDDQIDIPYSGGNGAAVVRKAYVDNGASAFFAVGGELNLPRETTKVRVRVDFSTTAPAMNDSDPTSKGGTGAYISPTGFGVDTNWSEPDIYNALFDLTGNISNRSGGMPVVPYYKYGTPRCGITKMKLLIVPNGDVASPLHTTYAIPPKRNTTVGLARKAALSDENDASLRSTFIYPLHIPEGVPPAPNPNVISGTIEELKEQYKEEIETGRREAVATTEGVPPKSEEQRKEEKNFGKTSINVEEEDRRSTQD